MIDKDTPQGTLLSYGHGRVVVSFHSIKNGKVYLSHSINNPTWCSWRHLNETEVDSLYPLKCDHCKDTNMVLADSATVYVSCCSEECRCDNDRTMNILQCKSCKMVRFAE